MSRYDDSQLVDYLFDEMSEEDARAFEQAMSEDAALSAQVEGLEETLGVMRELEDEEPSKHLDALILATARQTAEAVQEEREASSFFGRFRKLLLTPAFGLAAAASLAVVAVVSVNVTSFMAEPQTTTEAIPPGVTASARSADAPAQDPAPEPKPVEEAEEALAFGDKAKLERDGFERADDIDGDREDEARRTPKRRRARAARKPPPPPPPPSPSFDALAKKSARAPATGSASGGAAAPDPSDVPDLPIGGAAGPSAATPADEGAIARESTRQAVTKLDAADTADAKRPTSTPTPAKPSVRSLGAKRRFEEAPSVDEAPVAEAPAEAKVASKAEVRAQADKELRASATLDDGLSEAQRAANLASAMVKAAEQEIARKQYDSARRIFGRATQRVRGTPSEGEVLLRWAYFERDQRRYEVCVSLADRASRVPGFTRKTEAERLVRDASRRIEPQVAPAAPAPPR
ncbi:MAG: hypothetical protein RMA76_10225 [Deltaproteobacteria bacterium]